MRRNGAGPTAEAAAVPARDFAAQPAADSLARVSAELSADDGCRGCKLAQTRAHIVVGEGNPQARLLFIGESPGEPEDKQARPFVGKDGELLDKMIVAMGLRREDVYLANIIKCRTPDGREPEADEIAACSSFLERQIECIQPEVIVALGSFAAQTLLQDTAPITQLRGSFREFKLRSGKPVKFMPTLHPEYLLRNPAAKRDAWDDLKQVAKALALELPKK